MQKKEKKLKERFFLRFSNFVPFVFVSLVSYLRETCRQLSLLLTLTLLLINHNFLTLLVASQTFIQLLMKVL